MLNNPDKVLPVKLSLGIQLREVRLSLSVGAASLALPPQPGAIP